MMLDAGCWMILDGVHVLYTVENTFKAYYWDRLAGIAMVLRGGFEGDWGF